MRGDREHIEQSMLFQWAALSETRHPELALMYAVPNFARVSAMYGARMQREGKKKGVPDVVLPVPRGPYVGLHWETKVKPNVVTKEQRWWLERLRAQGWYTGVWWSWEEARDVILAYLALPPRQ